MELKLFGKVQQSCHSEILALKYGKFTKICTEAWISVIIPSRPTYVNVIVFSAELTKISFFVRSLEFVSKDLHCIHLHLKFLNNFLKNLFIHFMLMNSSIFKGQKSIWPKFKVTCKAFYLSDQISWPALPAVLMADCGGAKPPNKEPNCSTNVLLPVGVTSRHWSWEACAEKKSPHKSDHRVAKVSLSQSASQPSS